jgi:hypothetical protein
MIVRFRFERGQLLKAGSFMPDDDDDTQRGTV